MNTIHDLGGMDGFTLAERDQGRILKTEWERQIWGLLRSLRIPGYSTGGRAALESMPPELYLGLPYYARFLWRAEKSLIEGGFVTEEELANPDGPVTMPDIPNFVPPGPEETVARFARDSSA